MAKRGRKKAKDDKGYLESNKDNFTDYKVIDGNKITMKGVKGKIYAIPIDSKGQAGKGRLMSPEEEHEFEGATQIIELPESAMAQSGRNVGLTGSVPTISHKIMPTVAGIGSTIMNVADGIGGHLRRNVEADKAWWNSTFGEGTEPTVRPDGSDQANYLEGIDQANYLEGVKHIGAPKPTVDDGDYYFNDPDGLLSGRKQGEEQAIVKPSGEVVETNTEVESAYDPKKELGGEDYTKFMTTNKPLVGKETTAEDEEVTSDQDKVDPTRKIQFNNLYNGVDLTSASSILGKSFGYEGDQKGANAARGIGSGLKLLAGLGRNIMSGYGQEKRNNYLMQEDEKKRRAAMNTTISAQKGGLVKKDIDAINEATGIEFNAEIANNIFERVTPRATTPRPEIDFGKYKDVDYFRTGENRNGKVVIHNTEKNPMNYADNKRNALDYLRELNGDNFDFQYLDSKQRRPEQPVQVASRKSGGEVKPADLMSGAYVTGDDTVPPNVNVEEGEHVKDNETGRVAEVAGNKHTQGGENMNLDGAVLSDHNKIGGKLAKEYRDEFDINVKAKDTFATAMDKVLKKTGYKSLTDEMSKYIEKTEKEQERAKEIKSEATTGLNMQFLSGKINELNKQIEPLEEMKNQVFEKFFADQQAAKSPEEIEEENRGMEAATGKATQPLEAVLSRPKGVNDDQWKVAQEIYDAAVRLGDKFPELTVSQAALESAWFKKEAGKNNYFGQKGTKSQDTSQVTTHEVINGERVKIKDGFRNYQSIEEAVKDRMRLWGSRYQEAETLDEAVGIIMGSDGKSAYATDPDYASKVTSIATNLIGEGRGLQPVPDELKRQGKGEEIATESAVTMPWSTQGGQQDLNREDFDSDQPLTNIDGTPHEEGEDITETLEFREWFHNNKKVNTLPKNGIADEGIDSPEITTSGQTRVITEEERQAAEQENEETEEGRTDNTEYQTPLLPDQTPLPPSSLRLTDLQQVSPRDAEEKLISADTQIEEINRQFLAAKRSLDNLPASERVAALARLQSQTQQNINQVMAATNQQNAQIKGQTEQFNTQTRNQAEATNINLAKQYEKETLMAVDNTNQEMYNWFDRIQENQMGNHLTVQELNLLNQNASDFQYNANGEVEQTGKGLSQEDIYKQLAARLGTTVEEVKKLEKANKSAKRGRKV